MGRMWNSSLSPIGFPSTMTIQIDPGKRQGIVMRATLIGVCTFCAVAINFVAAQETIKQKPTHNAAVVPTHVDVKYGLHERNLMDVWLANADQPTPVLVSIHGGAFRHGDKSVSKRVLRECLAAGISVAAITYRFSDQSIAPAQHIDAARAIQFIRHNAQEWNIDPGRIASSGGSAGAGMSLWLGFHDDLADPQNDDPVLRQSTRLTCMAVNNGQSSYDPRYIRDLFPGTDTYTNSALAQLFDVDLKKLDDLPAEKYRLFEEVSALNHVTADDVPVLMTYDSNMDTPISSRSIGIHHPRFGKALKEKMDAVGIECHVEPGVQRDGQKRTNVMMAFIKRQLAASPVVVEDVIYSTVGGQELTLDIARPDGDGPFPAIVFIHGGGWYLGSSKDYRPQIEEAARRGYVAASISYRLMEFDESQKETTTATDAFPAQIHDAKAAIRWLRANARSYHIDPDHIGVTGRSAGGHLSLMIGLTDAESGLEGQSGNLDQSSRVQAVVNVFGPTDMNSIVKTSSVAWIFRLFMGGTPDAVAETYRAASPNVWASTDDPPVLTLHGAQDKAVPLPQAKSLDDQMKSVGASHTLTVFESQRHGFDRVYRRKELDAMWAFFHEHLRQ
jgi:acetyl esterase